MPPDPDLAAAAPHLCGADFDIAPHDLRIVVQAQHSSHRAAFILRSSDGIVDCIVSRGPNGEPITAGGSSYGSADAAPLVGHDDLFLAGESAGPPASRAYGRAAPGIDVVAVETTNSGIVEASAGEGWFLAMWPGVGQVVSVQGRDAAGAVVTTVPGFGDGADFDDWVNATPFPTLPEAVAKPLGAAIGAAEPFATELSRTPPALDTAFPLELAEYCDDLCPGVAGAGWGVVFEITLPDGQLGTVLVVLDSDLQLVLTEQ